MKRSLVFIFLMLLIASVAGAMSYKQYGVVEGNGISANQTVAVSMDYPHTRVVFDSNASATDGVDVYYQLLDSGDWISGGSATLNGTVNESNLVVDIDSEGVTGLKFVGSQVFEANILQFESGVAQKHWQ